MDINSSSPQPGVVFFLTGTILKIHVGVKKRNCPAPGPPLNTSLCLDQINFENFILQFFISPFFRFPGRAVAPRPPFPWIWPWWLSNIKKSIFVLFFFPTTFVHLRIRNSSRRCITSMARVR